MLLSEASFPGAYALNGSREDVDLDIYIFDSRKASGGGTPWDGRCSFIARSSVIVCDVKVIDNFISSLDWDKSIVSFEGDRPIDQMFDLQPADATVIDAYRRFFLIWMLGHEIGHFVHGHGTSHFVPDPLNAPTEPRSVSQAQELEADSYFGTALADDQALRNEMVLTFMFLLNTHVHLKVCPDISPLQPCPGIQVGAGIFMPDSNLLLDGSNSHPEFIIRTIRLIDIFDSIESLGGIGYLNRQMIDRLQVTQ